MASSPAVDPIRRLYSFGNFTLDGDRSELLQDGVKIRLRRQSFDVLRYLVERHGQLVTKDALMTAIWGDTIVTDDSLTQCMIDIRKVLGDGSRKVVRTVPRRGFIFDHPVEEAGAPHATAGTTRRHAGGAQRRLWTAAGLSLALVAMLAWWASTYYATRVEVPETTTAAYSASVAVLPFVDVSEQGDQEYFSLGISEGILNRLRRIPELTVIARNSSFLFNGTNPDIATIAATLNVAHVLAGSVNRSGERIRISARLVDASNGRQVWSQTYDNEFRNILVLQNEIVTAVAEALSLTQAPAPLRQAPSFPDVRAYERFLQGRFFYNRREPADLERAERYYRQALAIDSGYARAWSGLAAVYFLRIVQEDVALTTGLVAMQEAIDQALLHEPGLSEAHMRAAQLYVLKGDAEAAASHRRIAVALDPNDPLVLSAQAGEDAFEGRFDKAIEQQRRAVELDPLGNTARNNLAYFLLGGGRFADAQAQFQKVLEINPGASEAVTEIGFLLILQRRFEEAFAAIEKWPDGHFRDKGLALVCHSLGRGAEADETLGRLLSRTGAGAALELAEVYAWRGELDEAFRWLTVVRNETRSDTARVRDTNLAFDIRLSGFLQPLRDDPRWDELLAATND